MRKSFITSLPVFVVVAMTVLLSSCSSAPAPSSSKKVARVEAPPPREEWYRFPKAERVETKLVETELMGKAFMPGGTLGRYKKGDAQYEMFICRLASPDDAALLLFEWRALLANPKPVSAFGGFFGEDSGRPVLVFPKGSWIAGVAGLPQNDAEPRASLLAAYLD